MFPLSEACVYTNVASYILQKLVHRVCVFFGAEK